MECFLAVQVSKNLSRHGSPALAVTVCEAAGLFHVEQGRGFFIWKESFDWIKMGRA